MPVELYAKNFIIMNLANSVERERIKFDTCETSKQPEKYKNSIMEILLRKLR